MASIRQNNPSDMATSVSIQFGYGDFTASHVDLKTLIQEAYGMDEDQIMQAPHWSTSETCDIEARISSETANALHTLTTDAS